jgi:hypothetical protein
MAHNETKTNQITDLIWIEMGKVAEKKTLFWFLSW